MDLFKYYSGTITLAVIIVLYNILLYVGLMPLYMSTIFNVVLSACFIFSISMETDLKAKAEQRRDFPSK